MKSVPPASAPGSNSKVKIVKKPRDPELIESEINDLEKRTAELTDEMSKPEVARDITKLVAVNENYERAHARLAELYDEWERADSAAGLSKKAAKRR
jgi:protein subunit release factor A